MNAHYRELFRDQLTETPKKQRDKQHTGYDSHHGWVFVTNSFTEKPKAVRTYHSLFGASEAYTYFTPNTFYRNDQRHDGTLRWLNTMVIDIDVKNGQNEGLTFPDIMDRITEAGLPCGPSLVVNTPSSGFHVYFNFGQAKRAFPNVTAHYKRIQAAVAEAIGGDPQAVGAERWFRMPTPQNIVYQTSDRVSFDDLCDWYDIYREAQEEERRAVCVDPSGLLHHPALQKLLEGVSEGQRDNTCYTLALAYKAIGCSAHEAEKYLREWNQRNEPPMRQIDIKRKVKSAYKPGAPAGPSAYWIRLLSGMGFAYQTWEAAKPREERTYSHFDEWEKDIVRYLKENGGEVCGAQRKLAEAIRSSSDASKHIPYSTFKKVIERLIEAGVLIKKVEGKGRAALTTLKLKKRGKVVPFNQEKRKNEFKKNGLNSNTYIDQVVGGLTSRGFDRALDSSDRSRPG